MWGGRGGGGLQCACTCVCMHCGVCAVGVNCVQCARSAF